MKKIILLAALILSGLPTLQAKKVYAELVGTQKGLFSKKVKVRVDFGQSVSFWKVGDMILVDENGKDIVFNSMVDAMNFMGGNGWEFVQAYTVSEGNENVYRWLMMKDVNSDEEIKAGFSVRADNSGKDDTPTYVLTFMRKKKNNNQWDIVKTETKKLTAEELTHEMDSWKNQTNDVYDYDVQIKK